MDMISAVGSAELLLVLDETRPLPFLKRKDGCEGPGERT